ncbi:OmpP1/FadL family transporter [Rhodocaloribacter sp.]
MKAQKKTFLTIRLFGVFVALAAFAFFGETARAQGFGIYEQSTCAMGRAETGVALPCNDGSAIFYNPAGIAGGRGLTLSGGVTLVVADGDFTDDATGAVTKLENDPIPAPHAYAVYGFSDRFSAGLGVYVPYGLDTVWPADFDGAFLGYDNGLQSVYIQPTLAYRLNERVTVGGGLTVAVGSVNLRRRLDLSSQPVPGLPPGTTFAQLGIPFHTAFADARLDASGATGVGANVGALLRLTDRLNLGLRYLSSIKLDYDGDARFEAVPTGILLPAGNPFGLPAGTPLDAVLQGAGLFGPGGLLSDQGVRTSIEMPAQFVAGVSYAASDRLTVLADLQWTQWSKFDRIDLRFDNPALNSVQVENYDDTIGIRVGAQYAASERLTLRLGYLFNQAAAPDETVTPLLPEADRNHVTAGFTWQASPRFAVNVAYQYLGQKERAGRVREPEPGQPATTALNSGVYHFRGHLFGATLTVHL